MKSLQLTVHTLVVAAYLLALLEAAELVSYAFDEDTPVLPGGTACLAEVAAGELTNDNTCVYTTTGSLLTIKMKAKHNCESGSVNKVKVSSTATSTATCFFGLYFEDNVWKTYFTEDTAETLS